MRLRDRLAAAHEDAARSGHDCPEERIETGNALKVNTIHVEVPLRTACYKRSVAMFLVVLRRSGPDWDPARALEEQSDWSAHAAFMDGLVDAGFVVLGGPLADEDRVVHAVESESEEVIRATLARDPWTETHLVIETIDPWTIRLDGRAA